mgnify:CR=1 FL=1
MSIIEKALERAEEERKKKGREKKIEPSDFILPTPGRKIRRYPSANIILVVSMIVIGGASFYIGKKVFIEPVEKRVREVRGEKRLPVVAQTEKIQKQTTTPTVEQIPPKEEEKKIEIEKEKEKEKEKKIAKAKITSKKSIRKKRETAPVEVAKAPETKRETPRISDSATSPTTVATVSPPPKKEVRDPYEIYNVGVKLYNLGDYRGALESFLLASEIKPDDARILNNLGATYIKLGQNENAKKILSRAISVNPKYIKARQNIALVYAKEGKYEDAMANIKVAFLSDPDDPQNRLVFGLIYDGIGDKEGAVIELEKVWEDLKDPLIFYNLGRLYEDLGIPQKAKYFYRKAIAFGSDIPEIKQFIDEMKKKVIYY